MYFRHVLKYHYEPNVGGWPIPNDTIKIVPSSVSSRNSS